MCPMTGTVINENQSQLSEHLTNKGILYVIQLLPVEESYFLTEVGIVQVCQNHDQIKVKAFVKAKNSCLLTPFINLLVLKFSGGAFSDLVDLLQRQKKKIESLEKLVIPETLKEFRNSSYYCLPSQIKKYEGLLPKAKPIDGLLFKNE